jgi:hypothetical protein
MAVTIHTPAGSYSGKTVDTIVRRVWGARAFFDRSRDPNSPYAGQILQTPTLYWQRHGVTGWHVLAQVVSVDGDMAEDIRAHAPEETDGVE